MTGRQLAGLRVHRVHLDRAIPVLQVVDTRYQASRFGSGFKPRPKSDAGIRELPLAPLVVEAIRRQLPPDALQLRGPHDLRHSFSTWLEDEGIPARVIDELMGRQRSRRGELEGGSRIGAATGTPPRTWRPGSSKWSTADWGSSSRWRKRSPQPSWTRAAG